ncbi:hypothetical protein FACS189461_1420 [Spirochaetia bacterium]|nr:hypothetical protein FACS189461_1420 [Spirochaetia bacterium]
MKLENLKRVNEINKLIQHIDYFDSGSGNCSIFKRTTFTVIKDFIIGKHQLPIEYKYLREGIMRRRAELIEELKLYGITESEEGL